jgi:hypothetical protein
MVFDFNPTLVSANNMNLQEKYMTIQNYPNSFNPTTTVQYALPEGGAVKLVVYNQMGQVVEVLVNEFKEAGDHNAVFDAANISSGIYVYTLMINDRVLNNKMIYLK